MAAAKKKTRKWIIIICILAVIAVFLAVFLPYHNQAFPEAQEIAEEMDHVGRDYYFYGDSDIGFMIFAGSKTDEQAYAYLAELLHEEGYTVVIPKQPFYLSIFGVRHGIEIMDENPDIDSWILIGHSMGGRPISRIAASSASRLTGLVYLATYAQVDLSDLDFSALRISADHDGIMDNERMDTFAGNLPAGSVSIMLEGTNHVGFGAYTGTSHKDGEASISWQEQNEQTVRLILDFYADVLDSAEEGDEVA